MKYFKSILFCCCIVLLMFLMGANIKGNSMNVSANYVGQEENPHTIKFVIDEHASEVCQVYCDELDSYYVNGSEIEVEDQEIYTFFSVYLDHIL